MDVARTRRRAVPLNADPAAQLRLLDLQALDLKLDQLAHRRRALPESAELESLVAEHTRLAEAEAAATTEATDLERAQKRADGDVEQVRRRKDRDQQRLDTGQVSAARELENLQSEIASLNRRQAELEEVELEIMEKLEEVQQRLARLGDERAEAGRRVDEVRQARDAAWKQIDDEAEALRQEREAVAGELPDDLVSLYDKVRASGGGIGAAALRQRRCEGCRLELDPASLRDIRAAAPDAVVRCDECRRILVRTDESGL